MVSGTICQANGSIAPYIWAPIYKLGAYASTFFHTMKAAFRPSPPKNLSDSAAVGSFHVFIVQLFYSVQHLNSRSFFLSILLPTLLFYNTIFFLNKIRINIVVQLERVAKSLYI